MLAEHRLAAGLNSDEVATFLEGLVHLSESVTPRFRWRPRLRRDFPAVRTRFGIDKLLPADVLKRLRP